jgi:peroxiredoxin (alkyl hydroperoxide reductase subunit C)
MLTIGDKFPSFSLTGVVSNNPETAFKNFTNDSAKGKWQCIFFWPKDFTFVCPTEISAFGKLNNDFAAKNCVVYGASVDSDYVHMAWRNSHPQLRELPFPMLSDIKHELTQALGIEDKKAGVSMRATYLVDPEGTIRFVSVTDLSVGRNTDEVLRVLTALQSGELTGCNWQPGDAPLKAA